MSQRTHVQRQGGGPGRGRTFSVPNEALEAILEGNGRVLVEQAEKLGRSLQSVRVAQLRKIHTQIRRQTWDPNRLPLLLPRLAYARGREPGLKPLEEALNYMIRASLDDERRYVRVKEFMEAVVAYHASFSGEGGR